MLVAHLLLDSFFTWMRPIFLNFSNDMHCALPQPCFTLEVAELINKTIENYLRHFSGDWFKGWFQMDLPGWMMAQYSSFYKTYPFGSIVWVSPPHITYYTPWTNPFGSYWCLFENSVSYLSNITTQFTEGGRTYEKVC